MDPTTLQAPDAGVQGSLGFQELRRAVNRVAGTVWKVQPTPHQTEYEAMEMVGHGKRECKFDGWFATTKQKLRPHCHRIFRCCTSSDSSKKRIIQEARFGESTKS